MQLKCFLDSQDIKEGSNWERVFLDGLQRSCVFVPLISAAAIKPIERVSIFDDKADNLLLEYETALRLAKAKRIAIYPLLVGTMAAGSVVQGGETSVRDGYVEFDRSEFNVERFPNAPSKTFTTAPVRETMRALFKIQGSFVRPSGLAYPEQEKVVAFLRAKAWAGKDPDCLHLERYWQDPASATPGDSLSRTLSASMSDGGKSGRARHHQSIGRDGSHVRHDSLRRRLLGDTTQADVEQNSINLQPGLADEDL